MLLLRQYLFSTLSKKNLKTFRMPFPKQRIKLKTS